MFLEIEKNSVYIHPNITLQVIVQLDLWPQFSTENLRRSHQHAYLP